MAKEVATRQKDSDIPKTSFNNGVKLGNNNWDY
jgi:hypothetical protein